MKKFGFVFLLTLAAPSLVAQTHNLISGKYSSEELRKILIPQADWRPFPKLDDREGWSKADQDMMKAYVAKAETYLNYEWPSIPATKSLFIARTGDRSEYETVSFKKRQVLGVLLLAEIAENKGRFIDPIINGVWSICEESYWEPLPTFLNQRNMPA